jgi:CheY-like chemotaxis protein
LASGLSEDAKVLVVDNDRGVAESLAMLLETFGADVRIAYDGSAGVKEAEAFRPDIAFIDIRMPGIDGHETARRIRARLGANGPKLVAISGSGGEDDRALAKAAGFDLHLTKPVSAQTLADVVKRSRL